MKRVHYLLIHAYAVIALFMLWLAIGEGFRYHHAMWQASRDQVTMLMEIAHQLSGKLT